MFSQLEKAEKAGVEIGVLFFIPGATELHY
jgi:hypothetical protein